MRFLRGLMFALYFLAAALVCSAQVPLVLTPGTTTDPASPTAQSLAAALATASVPSQRLFLTVAAETVALAQNNVMPTNGSSLTEVTDAYGRSVRAFGAVSAIAPPTMTVLNMHPEAPDIYAGLQPEEAFKLLAASLSDPQWRDLTGESGLGLSDLSDEDQRRLFQAIFPDGSLKVSASPPAANMPGGDVDLSRELPQVRLRLGQNVTISLPIKGQPDNYIGEAAARPSYQWNLPFVLMEDSPSGLQQSAELPNVLKPGQLNWNLPALRVLVPLSGLKTVGDLISRVSQMAHLEIYADKHYESQSLTFLGGDNTSAPAAALLRALAFCVTGAFRQVGPAFVLTDDVIGVATRRKFLANFGQEVSLRLKKKLTVAGDTLATKHSLHDLSGFGDPLAPTEAQWKDIQHDSVPGRPWFSTDLLMNQLTAAQQASVQQEVQRQAQMAQENPQSTMNVLDPAGKMQIQIRTRLELLVPSLDRPVATSFALFDLFQASSNLQRARNKVDPAQKPSTVNGQPVTLSEAMTLASRRAVLIQPHTLTDLDSTIMVMKRLGFNQLWMDVFSEGQTHLTPSDGGGDLLTAAIKKTRGTGIQVFVVMDLFGWDASAPPDAVDLTVLGETSLQDDARQQQNALDEADADGYRAPPVSPVKSLIVTPLAPDVQSRLIGLVQSLARRPGLAGFVWRDTAPEGYNADGETFYSAANSPLGYTEGARLAFLRLQHADPIDVSEQIGSFTASVMIVNGGGMIISGGLSRLSGSSFVISRQTGTALPNFDNYAVDSALSQAWDLYRSHADIALMHSLYAAASHLNSTQRPLIWVEQRRNSNEDDWYGLWNSPTAPLPEWKLTATDGGRNQIDRLAKNQSRLALLGLDTDDLHGYTGLAALIHHRLLHTTWDGFALDLTLPNAPSLEALTAPAKPKDGLPLQKEGSPK